MNIQRYCASKNFFFNSDELFNFHCALTTKPFVILYGPSGTGKSKIAELYAEYVCEQQQIKLSEHLCFISVPPSWTSPTDLLGFYDYLNQAFIPSKLYQFIKKVENNPTNPYFLILDEMNLSVVEHYFSDFLSCLESRREINDENIKVDINNIKQDTYNTLSQAIILAFYDLVVSGRLELYQDFNLELIRNHPIIQDWKDNKFKGQEQNWTPQFRTEFNQKNGDGTPARLAGKFFENIGQNGFYKKRKEMLYLPVELSKDVYSAIISNKEITQHKMYVYSTNNIVHEIAIPLNLYIIGTINMDESTHHLSNKVIDRANMIEMNNISIKALDLITEDLVNFDEIDFTYSSIKTIPSLNSLRKLRDKYSNIIELIFKINDTLYQYRMNMGYRALSEIAAYILNFEREGGIKSSSIERALDFQLCQKLVPKLIGADRKIEDSVLAIMQQLANADIDKDQLLTSDEYFSSLTDDYPNTMTKLRNIYRYFHEYGFVNFANV